MTESLVVVGREAFADWLETTLLVRGVAPLGMDAVYQLAKEELQCSEAQVNLGVSAMWSRSKLLGERYPFHVMDVALRARPAAKVSPYAALVLLTPESPCRQLLHPAPTPEMARLFERVTEVAVAALWGEQGRSLRFGWPSDVGRPPEFPQAVEWLAGRMGIAVGAGYRPPRRKDGGVDVVGWRPFPDGRSGFPVLLVQCTLQADVLSKANDVDARLWSSWLLMDEEPATALAVPGTLPASGTTWGLLALRGLVLERLRLASLVPRDAELEDVREWVAGALVELRSRLQGGQW